MYDKVRQKIVEKYGSINKLAKAIDVAACDLYSAFGGKKPFYPGWKQRIAVALDMTTEDLFGETLPIIRDYNGTLNGLYDIVWEMSLRIKELSERLEMVEGELLKDNEEEQ